MNIYVLVEGEVGAKRIYENWIPLANPSLSLVSDIDSINDNQFSVVAGMGYPYYFEVIEDAIDEVNNHKNIDRLVISVDSEELNYQDKLREMNNFLSSKNCSAEIIIIIQHFCFEAWALGNRKVGPRNPKNEKLKEYKKYYNVLINDPECLPAYPAESLNRAQFAYRYLRSMLNDKHKNLTYRKDHTEFIAHKKYFNQLEKRFFDTTHIASFQDFLLAFI